MKKPFLIIVILLTLYCPIYLAASDQISFEHLSSKEGFPAKSVTSIVQDSHGFLWFGTPYGLGRYDGLFLQLYEHQEKQPKSLSGNNIRALYADNDARLWIGTKENGLNLYQNGTFSKIDLSGDVNKNVNVFSIIGKGDYIWVGADSGLYQVDKNTLTVQRHLFTNVRTLIAHKNDSIIVGSVGELINFNTKTHHAKSIFKPQKNKDARYRALHLDEQDNLWIGTTDALYKLESETKNILDLSHIVDNKPVLSIVTDNKSIWVGTLRHGLLKISKEDHANFSQYVPSSNNNQSISDNIVRAQFFDRSGNLWIGTFDGGVNKVSTQALSFNAYFTKELGSCINNPVIHDLLALQDSNFLIAATKGVYLVNEQQSCKKLQVVNSPKNSFVDGIVIFTGLAGEIWLGTNRGLAQVNFKTSEVYLLENTYQYTIYDIEQYSLKELLLATNEGLLLFNMESNSLVKIESETSLEKGLFYQIAKGSESTFFLATNLGLAQYQTGQLIKKFNGSQPALNSTINSVYANNDTVWIGGKHDFIHAYDYQGELKYNFQLPKQGFTQDLVAIMEDKQKKIWVSSTHGIYRINPANSSIKLFTIADGLQNNIFIRNSMFRSSDDKLYFGGKDGFVAFYPEDIRDNFIPPKVSLTKIIRFNEEVKHGKDYEGFSIDKPVEELSQVELSHRDYVIGLEFAGLHFADPMNNQYAYMLEGHRDEWSYTDAYSRVATYTNLKPGEYSFRVKAANKDGVWSLEKDNVALKVIVYPAPWLSWWAYSLYSLFVISCVLWFIRHRTQSAITRAKELEQEISERTKEISTQKNVIESLLERKNELFANISHEFRTPLTLILGPLEKELKSLDNPKNPKHLRMIQRNATRLLGMVEQILKLTELKKESTVSKVPQAVNSTLITIVESFQSLAESKKIKLSLQINTDANIMASQDALEVIIGNLVSNAIKYTPDAGSVSVICNNKESNIHISVTDTGVGMTVSQKEAIFERFVRLDKTSDTAGTGIGLSIVKELIKAHEGSIKVESTEAKGSTFTISLPTTKQAASSQVHSTNVIEHLTQAVTVQENRDIPVYEKSTSLSARQEAVLIIDDNQDMRDYIQDTLSDNYLPFVADRGELGLKFAIEQVPDLIICDIMMPGIDGYEVARRLRDNIITCHIPLILLTAKGDKKSRIQGWNENIDDYMTKPFDEKELLARVSNLTSLRNIIKQTNREQLSVKKEIKTHESGLNKKEHQFLEKIREDIEKNLSKLKYNRFDMASVVHVSERQLQRKLKALVNMSPMEFLKDIKLIKSAELLKDGYQVNIVADKCGFSSPSHFSSCFKAKYGMSPKQYQ